MGAVPHRGFLRGSEWHRGRAAADLELYDRLEGLTQMRSLVDRGPGIEPLVDGLGNRLHALIAAEVGCDVPLPESRLASLGFLWRRRVGATGAVAVQRCKSAARVL